jgi:hypothetical protein
MAIGCDRPPTEAEPASATARDHAVTYGVRHARNVTRNAELMARLPKSDDRLEESERVKKVFEKMVPRIDRARDALAEPPDEPDAGTPTP